MNSNDDEEGASHPTPENPSDRPDLSDPKARVPEASPSEHPTRSLGAIDEGASTPVPPIVSGYRIMGKLGEGGMGIVFEAEQRHPRRRVALKLVRGSQFVDEQQIRMLRREADTLARLEHPGIAAIHESGRTQDGRHFFAMELVRGERLDAHLRKRPGRLTPQEVEHRLYLFRKICAAVNYAHQRGVIHRDLKPSNIIVTCEVPDDTSVRSSAPPLPEIKILDFGLARITDADMTAATVVSEIGQIKGTLAYMSPEQTRGDPDHIDLRTDVYSLGMILYEMLAGCRPYATRGTSLVEAARVICEEPPRPLARVWRGIRKLDPDLGTIVHKALEKNADRRYASAAALSEDVGRFATSQPILARPPSTLYQIRKLVGRNKVPSAFAATLLIVLVGFGIWMSLLYERSQAHLTLAIAEGYASNLRAADLALRAHDIGEARRRLAACDPALRRWEWHHLQYRADSSLGVVPGGLARFAAGPPALQTFSRSGVRVWDPRSLESIGERELPNLGQVAAAAPVESVLAASRDGSWLVAGRDAAPRFWLIETAQAEARPIRGMAMVDLGGIQLRPQVFFSPDGGLFAVVPADAEPNRVGVLRTADARRLATVSLSGSVGWVAFTPDGETMAIATDDGTIRLSEVGSGDVIRSWVVEGDAPTVLEFDASGDRLVSGHASGAVRLREVATAGVLHTWRGHEGSVTRLAFTADGEGILSGGQDKTVRLWTRSATAAQATWRGHEAAISALSIDAQGVLVAASAGSRSRIWDMRHDGTGLNLRTDGTVSGLAMNRAGTLLALGLRSGDVHLVALPIGQPVREMPLPRDVGERTEYSRTRMVAHPEESNPVYVLGFARDDEALLSAGAGQAILIRDVESGSVVRSLSGSRETITALAMAPGGRLIAAGSAEGAIRLWLGDDQEHDQTLHDSGPAVLALAFNRDGTILASGDEDGAVVLWNTETYEVARRIRVDGDAVFGLAIAPEDDLLAAATRVSAHVWELGSGRPVAELGHGPMTSVAFDPDGTRILAAAFDGTIGIWDRRFELLFELHAEHSVEVAGFSPDGECIYSGGDETIRVWQTRRTPIEDSRSPFARLGPQSPS